MIGLVVVVTVVGWLVTALLDDWLPRWAADYVPVAIVCLCVGYVLGERAGRRSQQQDDGTSAS